MIKLSIPHFSLEAQINSYLQSKAEIGDTSLTIRNNTGFTGSELVLVGNIGEQESELRYASGVSGASTVSLSAALSYAHSVDAPVTTIPFDQIKVYLGDWSGRYVTGTISINKNSDTDLSTGRSIVTGVGTNWSTINASHSLFLKGKWYEIYSVDSATQITLKDSYEDEDVSGEEYALVEFTYLNSSNITVNSEDTVVSDSSGLEEDYYRTCFYNTQTMTTSEMSYPIGGFEIEGAYEDSLGSLTNDIVASTDPNLQFTNRLSIRSLINECQEDIRDEREYWQFQWTRRKFDLTDESYIYSLEDDYEKDKTIWFESDDAANHSIVPLRPVGNLDYYHKNEDQDASSSTKPKTYTIFGDKIYVYPMVDTTNMTVSKIYHDYYRKMPALKEDGDRTIIPNINLIKWYVKALVELDKGNETKSKLLMGMYTAGKRKLFKLDKKLKSQPNGFNFDPKGIWRFYNE